ncbi:TonB-dependent siderophore receptor [Pseudomonas sp. NFIX28]|uniref:TonB-dependent receptor n=1 Tax=Pseudomonas sp. NFIX28 TaxID=1566235 RepID=UPI00089D5D12|nr:TonB-dependent siderophore receptor [Pseudomonas sp. NFIX28]SDY36072.1 iron complex outermembrane recepter protein [Pseudomonas sp. NFIX28]
MSPRCKTQHVSPLPTHAASPFEFNRTFIAVHMALVLSLGSASMTVAAAQSSEQADAPEPAEKVQQQASASGKLELSETMIEGKTVAPGALPPVYAGGQVASGGRVGLLGNKDFMETPFSTISYTEKYIEDVQAQNITDVIAATDPAVFSNGLTGTHSENYSIRGFASNISDVSFGGLYGMAPYYRISPEMYERIEVLKGPSALLNGMPPGGSVAGTINLVPKRAGAEPLTRLTTTYMSDAQFGGHLDVGRRFGEEQQFGVRFNSVYRDGDTATEHQQMKVQLNSLGLDWNGERTRLSVDLYQSEDRVKGQNRGVGLAAGVPVPKPPKSDTLLNPDWGYVETKDKGVIVRGEYDLNDNITAYAAAGTSKTDYTYNGAISSQVINTAGDLTTTMGQLKIDLKKTSGEAGLRGKMDTFGIGHQWSINATHYSDEEKDYGRRSVPGANWITNIYNPVWGPEAPESWPAVLHTESRLTSYGFADTLSFLDERLQITLGVRRQQVLTDTFSVTTGAHTSRYDEGATTPAAAVLLKVTDEVSLYANYIEGLSKGATAPLTAANAGEVFAPYKSKQKEVGVKLDLGDFAHTLSLYQIERPNSYTDPATNVFSFGGEQRNRGVEWSFFGTPVTDVRLMGGVARVDPKVTKTAGGVNEGKLATGQPKLQGKLGVEWDTPILDGLTLTANATSVSKQYINADNSKSIPGYTIYDVGARYAMRVASHPVTLRGTVNNVTNKDYWGIPLTTTLGLGAPRTVQLSASVDF